MRKRLGRPYTSSGGWRPRVTGFALAGMLAASAGGCTATTAPSPRDTFINSCVSAASAMLVVVNARTAGKIPDDVWAQATATYAAVAETCKTVPPTDDAATLATDRITALIASLTAAGMTTSTTTVPSPL